MQTGGQRKYIELLEIANAHRRVPLSQALVECRVTRRIEFAVNAKRTVETEYRAGYENVAKQLEHHPDRIEVHDVGRVRRERRVKSRATGVVRAHVKFERRQYVVQIRVRNPCTYAGTVFRDVCRLPIEVRQMTRKGHRMLPCARAYLEYSPSIRKFPPQYLENGGRITLRGRGEMPLRHCRKAGSRGTRKARRSNRECLTMRGEPRLC